MTTGLAMLMVSWFLPKGLIVNIMYGDGGITGDVYSALNYSHNIGGVTDLRKMAVQVIGPAEGWSY